MIIWLLFVSIFWVRSCDPNDCFLGQIRLSRHMVIVFRVWISVLKLVRVLCQHTALRFYNGRRQCLPKIMSVGFLPLAMIRKRSRHTWTAETLSNCSEGFRNRQSRHCHLHRHRIRSHHHTTNHNCHCNAHWLTIHRWSTRVTVNSTDTIWQMQ